MREFSQVNVKWFLKRLILDLLILLTTKFAVFLVLIWAEVLGSVDGLPVCAENFFWLRDAENCEPCGTICDPPAVYETDCKRLCPGYRATTTPPPDPKEPEGLSWELVVVISGSVVAGLCVLALLVYCVWRARARLLRFVQPCLPMKFRDNKPVQEQCQRNHVTDDSYQSLGSTTPEGDALIGDAETRTLDAIVDEA